jgi:hypothetical protein
MKDFIGGIGRCESRGKREMIVGPFDSEKSGSCGFKVRASCGSKDAGLVSEQTATVLNWRLESVNQSEALHISYKVSAMKVGGSC